MGGVIVKKEENDGCNSDRLRVKKIQMVKLNDGTLIYLLYT